MASQEETFRAFLRGRRLKFTSERRTILVEALDQPTHFDAESLHRELRRRDCDVSRATVYRTLDLLIQCGLLRKSSLGSSHANFEAARGSDHHDHLICMACQKVLEFYREDLESLQDQVCSEAGFKPLHHSLQIFGLCSECRDRADENTIRARVSHLHA